MVCFVWLTICASYCREMLLYVFLQPNSMCLSLNKLNKGRHRGTVEANNKNTLKVTEQS